MESKNVKIIDEHNIDRNANIVCAFNFNNVEYVLYWIDRDEDNANLFVSKLLKNNDNTYNMLNIDDSMEKNRVSEIVKKVVSMAVKSEDEKANTSITLDDGTNITLFSPLFNREQNINVTKTYVTTVKKSVAKVSRNYLEVKAETPVAPAPEPMFNDIFVDAPKTETNEEMTMPETPVVDNVVDSQPASSNEEIMNSFVDNIAVPAVETTTPEPLPSPVPAVEPIFSAIPDAAAAPEPVPQSAPAVETPAPVPTFVEPTPIPVPTPAEVAPLPSVNNDPMMGPVQLGGPVDLGTPDAPKEEPKLVFDASNEVNLNGALNSGDNNNVVVTNDDNSLRAFGQDGVANEPQQPAAPTGTTNAGGFAHFKAVAAIGLVVFMGACAFMGYEIFNYFQIVNK